MAIINASARHLKAMPLRDLMRRLRPSRPRLQYRLRSLLLAMVTACVVLGWHVDRVRRQRLAVAALTAAGATIEYYRGDNSPYTFVEGASQGIDEPRPFAAWVEWATPHRLRTALGIDFFRRVKQVDFFGSGELPSLLRYLRDLPDLRHVDLGIGLALDEDLAAIGKLGDLTDLVASFGTITDAGLVHLRSLDKLEHLDLSYNEIAGKGLVHFVHMRELKDLDLSNNPLTDADLAPLANLQQLEALDLSWSRFTGTGLGRLAGLSKLESLNLSVTGLRREHLVHLAKLGQLKTLALDSTAVGDAELQNLREMRNIESLGLGRTLVTDHGLESIRSFAGLKQIFLEETAITDKGVRTLGELDSLNIVWIDKTAVTPEGAAWLKKRLLETEVTFNKQGDVAANRAGALVEGGLWREALAALSLADSSYLKSAHGSRQLRQCYVELGEWEQAEREYSKIFDEISAKPSSQWWYGDSVWQELYGWPKLLARVARSRPDDVWRWTTSARNAVVDGRWSAAAADYARAVDCPHILDPLLMMHRGVENSIDFQYGVSRLLVGDLAEQRRVCDRLVEGDPQIEANGLTPETGYDYYLLAAVHLHLLAPQGTACRAEIADRMRDATYKYPLEDLIYCRAGLFEKVLAEERPGMHDAGGRYWFVRAMAHQHLGHDAEARDSFRRGTLWLARRTKADRIERRTDHAGCLLEAEVLRREAERLIDAPRSLQKPLTRPIAPLL